MPEKGGGVLRANGPSPIQVAGSTAAFAKLPGPVAAIRDGRHFVDSPSPRTTRLRRSHGWGSSLVSALRTEPHPPSHREIDGEFRGQAPSRKMPADNRGREVPTVNIPLAFFLALLRRSRADSAA